jgi:hypothetical protein
MSKYSLEQLKHKLTAPGWRTITGNKTQPLEGTLSEMAEAAHARHVKGHAAGYLQEIETEIEIDALQLQELWYHMGLPMI